MKSSAGEGNPASTDAETRGITSEVLAAKGTGVSRSMLHGDEAGELSQTGDNLLMEKGGSFGLYQADAFLPAIWRTIPALVDFL